jgi:uncharacterized protein (DUF58 family)
MLTARGRWTIALGLIAGLLGRILGIPELFGLAAAVVVVALAAVVRVRVTRGAVSLSARAIPAIVEEGKPAVLELTIEASGLAGSLSSPLVLATDSSQGSGFRQPARIVVPRLAPGDRTQATFALPTERRGLINAGAYVAGVCDPLNLAWRRMSVSRPTTCYVLPRVESLATMVPQSLGRAGNDDNHSLAARLAAGSSMLRRYAEGDDLRRVHWRTTARVGELMVRDGGTGDDPDRVATTVLLDAGGETTPLDELDRAVEVAASVLSAAVGEAGTRVGHSCRVVTTTGVDTGVDRGDLGLRQALIALAGVEAAPEPPSERLRAAIGRLGVPNHDEVLVIVGAFGQDPPDGLVLDKLSSDYSTVVLVLVGAKRTQTPDESADQWPVDAETEEPGGTATVGFSINLTTRGRSGMGVLTVPLPRGSSLAAAWSRDPEEPAQFAYVGGAPDGHEETVG